MRLVAVIAQIALVLPVPTAGDSSTGGPILSSLKGGCALEKQQLGGGPFFSSMWLKCGSERFLLAHPLNLLGKVTITSETQALEFVRLFEGASYFLRLGITELTPGDSQGCYVVPTKAFEKHLRAPRVVRVPLDRGSSEEAICPGCAAFDVTRPVALEDGRVYELRERVLENGYYNQETKRLLFKDPAKVGTHFICDL